jgi:hypothetical protein
MERSSSGLQALHRSLWTRLGRTTGPVHLFDCLDPGTLVHFSVEELLMSYLEIVPVRDERLMTRNSL